ncbi:MAG: YlbF family regulator [Lachnospira sp.]
MQKIEELKLELADAIRNSPEYKEYKHFEKIIDRDPDLRRTVDEFRRQNFEIQNSVSVEDVFWATQDLNNRFADMRNTDTVNRYLSSEICLCRMIQDICKDIVDSVDFNLDFLK